MVFMRLKISVSGLRQDDPAGLLALTAKSSVSKNISLTSLSLSTEFTLSV